VYVSQGFWQPVYCPGRLGTRSWGPKSNHWVSVKTLSLDACFVELIFFYPIGIELGPSSWYACMLVCWKIKFPRFWQRAECPIPPPGGVVSGTHPLRQNQWNWPKFECGGVPNWAMPHMEDWAFLVLFRNNFTQVKLSVSKFVLLFFFYDPTLTCRLWANRRYPGDHKPFC